MKKVLLHTCCAPCAAPSAERLILDGHEVLLYFSNFNVYPQSEYPTRRSRNQ